jgi:hypothetical protein
MERQPDCEQIHLMHLAVIKQQALKKRPGQVSQTKLNDFFVKKTQKYISTVEPRYTADRF